MDDDDGIERGGAANSSTGGGGGSDSKTAGGGGAGAAPAPKAKEIPTPQIDAVADYEALVEASYKLPESYIRTKKLPAILAPGGAFCGGWGVGGGGVGWVRGCGSFGTSWLYKLHFI